MINFSFMFLLKGVFRQVQGGKGGKCRVLPDNIICTFLKFINIIKIKLYFLEIAEFRRYRYIHIFEEHFSTI